jgi:uncharacterized protein
MIEVFIIDACAMIAFLGDEEGATHVERILSDARDGKSKLFMNSINLLEVFYGIYREDGPEMAEMILEKISKLPIKLIDTIKENVFREAGRLKATYKISLADSIVLAEALIKKALLVTADHHEFDILEKKERIRFSWIR